MPDAALLRYVREEPLPFTHGLESELHRCARTCRALAEGAPDGPYLREVVDQWVRGWDRAKTEWLEVSSGASPVGYGYDHRDPPSDSDDLSPLRLWLHNVVDRSDVVHEYVDDRHLGPVGA